MSLGTLDDEGVWVSDVVYIHDENFNLYWISDPEARHSKSIVLNNKVAGSITISNLGEKNAGIQFYGEARKLDGSQLDLVKKFLQKKHLESKEDKDILQGDSWYAVKPKRIDLIFEEVFGWDKQNIDL